MKTTKENSNDFLDLCKIIKYDNNDDGKIYLADSVKEWIDRNIKRLVDKQGKEEFIKLYNVGFFNNEFEEDLLEEWDWEFYELAKGVKKYINDEVIKYL